MLEITPAQHVHTRVHSGGFRKGGVRQTDIHIHIHIHTYRALGTINSALPRARTTMRTTRQASLTICSGHFASLTSETI